MPSPGLWAVSSEMNGQEVAYVLGLLWTIFPLWGAIKCIAISRRTTTNTMCALGLAALCAALALPGFGPLIRWLARLIAPDNETLARLVALNFGILFIGLLLVAVILASLGLIAIKRDTEGRYVQGRRQAKWALLVSLLMLFSLPFVGAIAEEMQSRRLVQSLAIAGAESSAPGAARLPLQQNADLNFLLRDLDRSWTPIDAKKINHDATLAYIHRSPEVYFFVIAEKLGVELSPKIDALQEICRTKLHSSASNVEELDSLDFSLCGLPGKRILTKCSTAGNELFFDQWIAVHNGYVYQLHFFGRASDRAKIEGIADRTLRCFDLIDPTRICHTQGFTPLEKYSDPQYGCTIALSDNQWRSWKDLAQKYPSAAFGGLSGQEEAMIFIPVVCQGLQPPLEARLEAFLSLVGCPQQLQSAAVRKQVHHDGLDGIQCNLAAGPQLGSMYYRVLVFQNGEIHYCLAVWSVKSEEQADAALADILSRVHFTKDAHPDPAYKLSDAEKHRFGAFFNFVGLYFHHARQFAAAEPYYLRAIDCDPHMAVALDNYAGACMSSEQFQAALDAMQKHLDLVLGNRDLQLANAFLLSKTNHSDEAIRMYQAAFKDGARSDDHFAIYAKLLVESGKVDAALAACDNYLSQGDALSVVLMKAHCLSQKGEHDQSIDLLKARLAAAPGNPHIAYALIDSLQAADRLSEALTLAKQVLADGYDSIDTQILKGSLELRLKWYKDAKATFEAALKRAPADDRIQNYLNHVSAILGEAANVNIKEPLTPVTMPTEWDSSPPPTPSAEALADAAAYYRSYVSAVEFVPEKLYRVTTQMSIKVLNDVGASRFSTLETDFDPLSEQIFVNRLDVFDSNDKLIASGDVADYFVADVAGRVASFKKTLHIPVPGSRPGCRIEFCVTTQDIVPPKHLPYSEHYFAAMVPCGRDALFVRADPALVAWDASDAVQPTVAGDYLYWKSDSPVINRSEPFQDDLATFAPLVRVVDKQTTWKGELDEYRQSIQHLTAVSDNIKSLAADLTRDTDTSAAKISALLHYVQQQVSYKAIEFGRRARIMNSAEKTLRNKYGDCKDHSLLLCQLLQAAGIPAELALVQTKGTVSDKTPSLDQFDHMIVCVHDGNINRFIDPTVKDFDTHLSIPYGLAGRQALLLSSDDPLLTRIPDYPDGSNTLDVQRHIHIAANGAIEGEDRISYVGYFATALRSYWKSLDPSQRRPMLQSYFSDESGVQIGNATFESLEEPDRPLVITVTYKWENGLQHVNDQWIGRLPAPWEQSFFTASPVDARTAPVWVQYPVRVSNSITVEPPAGFACAKIDSLQSAGKSLSFDWQRQASSEDNKLVFHCSASRSAGHFPASQYAAFRDTTEQVRQIFSPSLALKPVAK